MHEVFKSKNDKRLLTDIMMVVELWKVASGSV